MSMRSDKVGQDGVEEGKEKKLVDIAVFLSLTKKVLKCSGKNKMKKNKRKK